MSVGELFAWGETTGGEAKSIEDFRSYRVNKLSGGFTGASVLFEGTAKDLLGAPIGEQIVDGVKDVAVGTKHALLLAANGKVLACGTGDMGQLGLGAKIIGTSEFVVLSGLDGREVTQIACGAKHSAAVSSSGDLYMWGSGLQGQTGLASASLDEKTNDAITGVQLLPKLLSSFVGHHKIRAVACGEAHTACVTEAGEVWCWGEGRCGKLGYGKVRKQARPKRTLEKCEAKGAPFVQVACGWAHTIARTKLGDVYVWGFNAFGQLGLGHPDAAFYPQQLSVIGRGGEPCKVVDIAACENYSACRNDRKDLYTWGCGGHGRLGHGANDNMYAPTLVECLQGKQVSSVGLTANDMFVFVPSVVYTADPPCGPISGGTKVTIHGGGFWETDGVVIRFEPKDPSSNPNVMARSSVGSYYKDADPEAGEMQQLQCRTPRFSDAVVACLEVAMNGADFTANCVEFQYYENPVPESISPLSFSAQSSKEVRIKGKGFFETDLIQVRFKEKGSDSREVTVKGWIVEDIVDSVENPETEELEDVVEKSIVCKSPLFEGSFPMEARVSVALNGSDFVLLQNMNVVVHNASTKSAVPSSAPTNGGTKIHVHGSSFYAAPTVCARISVGARGAHYVLPNPPEAGSDGIEPPLFELAVPVTVHTKEKLSLTVPTTGFFSEKLGQADTAVEASPADEEGGGGEDVNLEEPEELPEDAAEEGEAAAAAPTADSKTLLEMFPDNILAVNAVLEVTVDGDEYLEKPIDMCFFRPGITFAVEPAAGPASGGTPVSLLVDGVLFDGSEAKVKFDAATDGGLPGGLDVDAEASVSTDGVQSTIQCTTGALSEALDELAALANPAPVEAAEDEEEEEGAVATVAPIQTVEVPVKLSLNGVEWLSFSSSFLIYTVRGRAPCSHPYFR